MIKNTLSTKGLLPRLNILKRLCIAYNVCTVTSNMNVAEGAPSDPCCPTIFNLRIANTNGCHGKAKFGLGSPE